jgi:hypothetical protein
MNERIRTHIEELFENAPNIKKITELKEELLSNSNSKYDDLLAGGASPDVAYKTVISGMGDVAGLIEQLKSERQADSAMKGMRAALSGILWPLIFITYFLVSFITGAWHISWIIFIAGACIEGVISLLLELKKGE